MNLRNEKLIATAVGVLVLGLPLALIALKFPEATKNALLDITMLVTCGVFMIAWAESRGFRHLLVGLFFLPMCFFAFNEVVGDLVTMLVAIGFAGWLVFGLVRKMRLQREITRYLAGVAVTALCIAAFASVADPENKVHATLAFMLAATAYLGWRRWAGPKELASPRQPDPWRWSRDKDGNWRA